MTDTIESFVSRLRSEGVDAGQAEAERLIASAKDQAKEILAKATQEAESIRTAATDEAQQTLTKAKADLDLAVRDTIARLRAHLGAILGDLLTKGSDQTLGDATVLAEAVTAIISAHATAAAEGRMTVTVPEALHQKVASAAMASLAKSVADGALSESLISGGLSHNGFAYRVDGATVEVDAASVVEHLRDMVNPMLREALDRAS